MYDMTGFDYDISDVVNLLKLQVRHKNSVSLEKVQYGDITTPNRPFYSEAEELMLWAETSYRGPLVPAGNKRYQELFQKIMPKEAAFL